MPIPFAAIAAGLAASTFISAVSAPPGRARFVQEPGDTRDPARSSSGTLALHGPVASETRR